MRPVSGDDLVAAALHSSLSRAQKLSNYQQQQRKRSGNYNNRSSLISLTSRKPKNLKFQSEFDLWIELAENLTFTSEGYVNGVSVPKGIECLNATPIPFKNKPSPLSVNPEVPRKTFGASFSGTSINTEDGSSIKNNIVAENSSSVLKGKNKSNSTLVTENSFDLLKKLKESRKEKKVLVKLRKRFLKEGFSQEETEKLIIQAKGSTGGVGAIFQKLKKAVLAEKERSSLAASKITTNSSGNIKKMRDMENGDTASSSSRPTTPPARPIPSTSSSSMTVNGVCGSTGSGGTNGTSPTNNCNQHQLPQPKRILYPREKIVPGYTEKLPIGAGFFNMGNSCYLNASLQAVFHVPAFINWLRHDVDHRRHCQDNMSCIICAMKKTLDSAMSRQQPPPSAIRPVEIINRLRSICRHFSHGRQEDAHEFLRYLFESMERSYLAAINCLRIDNRSKETNPLSQIFGGYLRTEVTCVKCHYVSTTFQPTAELQLDIRHVTSLDDAILNHFKKERLDNNDYKCEKCRTISQATKQFSLEIPPIVLCLQLKRFTLYGTKIAKRIHCNRYLDMSRFMHKSKQVNGFTNLRYRLVALVTHLGSSPNCGHYTAIAEASNGNFYQFDDSYVHQVTVSNALNNDAYVIIYEMDKRTYKSPEASATTASSNFTPTVSNLSFPSSTVTSSCMYQSKKLSSPIPKLSTPQTSKLVQSSEKATATATSPLSTNGVSSEGAAGGRSLLSGDGGCKSTVERKAITFGITQKKINILKPGVLLTNSSKFGTISSPFANGASSAASSSNSARNESKGDRTVKLVPYNDDEESDSESVRASLSSKEKRLKSPEAKKQSPKRNGNGGHEFPITPPKSPKPVSHSPSNNARTPSPSSREHKNVKNNSESTQISETSSPKQISEPEGKQRDGVKRKAPSDDDDSTPRKSRSMRRRQSSSPEDSSRSPSNSPDGKSKNSSRKRRRSEESNRSSDRKASSSQNSSAGSTNSSSAVSDQNSRRERESISRESFSQERDRERRKDRNPSPCLRERRASSTDRKQPSSEGSCTFDVSRLRNSDSIVGWDGQKSFFSKTMDEHRKKSSEKDYDEEYNDNFDEGRVKKVRRSLSVPRESESNKFQIVEDRKRQVDMLLGKTNLGGSSPGSSRRGSGSDTKSWTNGDLPRHRRSNSNSSSHRSDRSESSNSGNSLGGLSNDSRPRHSNSSNNSHSNNSNTNYSKNSHGRRSPYRNGHHSNGGSSHYRSQSHSSYHHHNSSNKHWSRH